MKTLRIGTRESALAVQQARQVQQHIERQGVPTEIVYVKSDGDIDLATPLYELGVQGIFTKTLDAALLVARIDVAVHSYKDIPTQLAEGTTIAAVLERASHQDIVVPRNGIAFLDDHQGVALIATSSLRRRAQWLHRYRNHNIENLRGNVNSRLQKLSKSKWDGAIFAAAGLERIQLRPSNAIDLDWMLPAPAQGAIAVSCRHTDDDVKTICLKFHHHDTALCTKIERDFLRGLLGGCSTPIAAWARVENDHVLFNGNMLTSDGKNFASYDGEFKRDEPNIGFTAAKEVLKRGGDTITKQWNSDAQG